MLMINKILPLLIFSCSCLFGLNSSDSLFHRSNDFYKNGQFEKALDSYLNIPQEDLSCAVYYNIGNCYFKLKRLGYSRLYYEKAKLCDPSDKDVSHNLEILKTKLIDEINPVPDFFLIRFLNSINSTFNDTQWAYLFIALFYFNIILFVVFLFSQSVDAKINFLRTLFFSIPVLLVVCFLMLYSNQLNKFESAVLINSNTYVKTAPSISASDYFIIHEGLKFQIIDQVDGWSRIKLKDGKDGWVENTSFLKISL